jgi:hypothetical protein
MKTIKNFGETLNKKEQQQIHGGFGFGSCFQIQDETVCGRRLDCSWYGCYCGPQYPHIAPC